MFGFVHEQNQKEFTMIPVTRGAWHTIMVDITWSQGEDGKAKVFFDDMIHPVIEVKGKNMLNAYQHYLKIGSYRHKDITADSTVHIRNVTIKTLIKK